MIGAALQKAVYAALNAEPAVAGGRIYDGVPRAVQFPYVTIGDEQVIEDGNACGDGWEVFVDVHVWSRPALESKVEVKELAGAVAARLNTEIPVEGFATVLGKLQTIRIFLDPDGKTQHAVVTARYLLDPL